MGLVNAALKDEGVAKVFAEGETIRCLAHAHTSMANQDQRFVE